MRVRVKKATSAYWNYAIHTYPEGSELDGDLARHLADNAPKGHIEVLEGDPAAASPPAPTPPGPEPKDPEGGSREQDDGEPPLDGTVDQLMQWVGEDTDRATRALAAEQARERPRSTLVKRLEALTETGQ
jgi:hypothetical protein